MSGPIVRSGPSTKYQQNWDTAFGDKKSTGKKKSSKSASKTRSVKKKK